MKTIANTAARVVVIFFLALSVTACSETTRDSPGMAVENYFQSIVDSDEDRIATLSCADWEASARADVAAFYGVKARLENVDCHPIEAGHTAQDDTVVVECSGAIIATYNNEDASFELAGKQLRTVYQSGEWLVCGYAE